MRRLGPGLALSVLLGAGWLAWAWIVEPEVPPTTAPAPAKVVERAVQGAEPVAVEVAVASSERTAADVVEEPTSEVALDDEGVRVRVVDPEDAPIAGARVRVTSSDGVPAQVTGEDGCCVLAFDPGEDDWQVLAEAEGYFPAASSHFSKVDAQVRLHPRGVLSGRVLEKETRLAVAGARVRVPVQARGYEAREVVCNASGRFAGLEIPLGKPFRIDARASGYLDTVVRQQLLEVQPDERDPTAEVLLEPVLIGEFTVVDSDGGAPVAGANVSCAFVDYTTDARGRVRVDRSLVPSDRIYRLCVNAEGYSGTWFEVVEVGEPDAPIELRLPRACRVVGTIRDVDGRPLSDAFVAAMLPEALDQAVRASGRPPQSPDAATWADNATWTRHLEAQRLEAADEGRFAIEGVPPGLPELTLIVGRGLSQLETRPIGPLGPPGSMLEVDWQLAPRVRGDVRGVLSLNGAPHPGEVWWQQGSEEGVAIAGASGAFAINGLAYGDLELNGLLHGEVAFSGSLGMRTRTVTVQAEGVTVVELDYVVAMDEVRGTLSGPDGAPRGGVTVHLRDSNSSGRFRGVSAADGTWSVRVADLGTPLRVLCEQPFREEGLEVAAGARDVALHLLGSGRLRFRAVDARTDEALASLYAMRRTADGEATVLAYPGRDAPGTDGWIEVELPEGEHEVYVWNREGLYQGAMQRLAVPVNATVQALFRLEPAHKLTLRLASGVAPLPEGHALVLLPEDEWPLVTAAEGSSWPRFTYESAPFRPWRSGELRLTGAQPTYVGQLAPGRHRFKVFPDDVAIEPEVVDVPAEGVVEVRWVSKP
ncbi:MAG TPA: hypothetical protein VMT18_07665 [Planctomycetota bacterium]|nr:hypothetical protein [Planctomycetota bacterium]